MTFPSMKTTIAILLLSVSLLRAADPQKAAELWRQSLTDESNQDYAAALKKIVDFKSAGGETYLATIRTAWLSYLAKDYDKAVQFYTAAAKQEPRAITPHLGLVYSFLEGQKPKEALTAAHNGLNIDQYNFKLLLIAGELLFNQGDYRKAETYFDRAHHLQPEDPIAMSWLGWSKIGQGQMKLAAPIFEMLVQINPDGYLVRDGFAVSHGPPPDGPGGGPPGGGPPGGGPPPR
jgi:tetratricopeptide (TPR) repeat protein